MIERCVEELNTQVANNFNQDSATKTKAIQIIMKETGTDIMLKREPIYREVR